MDIAVGRPDTPRKAGRRPLFDRYLTANIALWVLTYVLTTARVVVGMDTPLPTVLDMSARRVVVCAAAALFCVFIQWALQKSWAQSLTRRLALAAALSFAGGAFWTVANFAAFYLVRPVRVWNGGLGDWLIAAVPSFSVLIWSFIAWCAIVFAIDYDQLARENTLRLVEAEGLAAESQNQMLRNQINPHFLFNTLNALSSLILQKDFDRAERMVLSLSNFLRASLEKAPSDKIALADELTVQRQYLAIEQERFGDRLVLRETVPANLRDALAPGLILQPLIENAVKYGVARTTRPVLVEIIAEVRGGRLAVTVQDDAVATGGAPPQTLGLGLENVRRRLAALYGAAGVLTAGPRPGGGFAATVELPLERR